MATRKVLILEDDPRRVERFRAVLSELDAGLECVVWHDAHTMIKELPGHLADSVLISLDHDLDSIDHPDDAEYPGDGRQVVRFLMTIPPTAPVLIHSSNDIAADEMEPNLAQCGWNVVRVEPFCKDWIEVDWKREIQNQGIA